MKRLPSILLIAAMVLLTASQTSGRESHIERDGNWWTGQEDAVKNIYIQGLMAGVELGGFISVASLSNQPEKLPCQHAVEESWLGYMDKYFDHVTAGQIEDRLDTFYADHRNGGIKVHLAVWVVVNKMAGTPEQEINAMTEKFRKKAATH